MLIVLNGIPNWKHYNPHKTILSKHHQSLVFGIGMRSRVGKCGFWCLLVMPQQGANGILYQQIAAAQLPVFALPTVVVPVRVQSTVLLLEQGIDEVLFSCQLIESR